MTRWTAIQCSDFALYARWLNHEPIDPILAQRATVGFNLLRAWLLNTSVYRIVPSDWPDFYGPLRPFVEHCARFGLYVEFTCFTQTQTLMPNPLDQQRHLDLIGQGLVGATTKPLLSKKNEGDQHDNQTAEGLRMPTGFLCSNGSNGADSEPPTGGDYEEYHTNGLFEWWRKTGHNSMEWATVHGSRVLGGENTRFIDQDASATHAYDAAAGATLLCVGSCYHSQAGKLSQLWQGHELTCAQAWADGARSVPLTCQPGPYVHRFDLETPGVIRAYQRGSDPACIVRIRA